MAEDDEHGTQAVANTGAVGAEGSGINDGEGGTSGTSSRATLILQARKFLESDDIQDASEERKKGFLEKKGLLPDEIQGLLSGEQITDSPTSGLGSKKSSKSSAPPLPSTPPPALSNDHDNHGTPPIVTYPEFLTRRRAAPPLVTAQGLLGSLYIAAGASTVAYAGSKYIITPMVNQLTEARHSLADTALSRLALLNEKLESAVSEVPLPRRSLATDQTDHSQHSVASSDSDPTELFHVDIGTQTSPFPSRRPSSSSTSSNQASDKPNPISKQIVAISSLHDQIEELMVDSNLGRERESVNLKGSISELKKYLEGFTYSSPYYSNNSNNAKSITGIPKYKASAKDESDAINQVRSEIRSIKGVFLNARNFPSGGSAARGASRVGA